uniref:Uncharacterized protein n=1 Tax=Oryza meridionalis TaxID=40149 RepID=A0A0E0DF59_9ORYZ
MLQGEAPHHHHRKQSAWTKYIYTMYSKSQSQLGSLIERERDETLHEGEEIFKYHGSDRLLW